MQMIVYPCALARFQKDDARDNKMSVASSSIKGGQAPLLQDGLTICPFSGTRKGLSGGQGTDGTDGASPVGGGRRAKRGRRSRAVMRRSQVDFWALRQPEAAPPNVKNSVDYMTKGLWLVVQAISHPILPASSPVNLDKLYNLRERFQGSNTLRGKIR
jgi:hypothetical protein